MLTDLLDSEQREPEETCPLAVLISSAIEGAIALSGALHSLDPLGPIDAALTALLISSPPRTASVTASLSDARSLHDP